MVLTFHFQTAAVLYHYTEQFSEWFYLLLVFFTEQLKLLLNWAIPCISTYNSEMH